MVPSIKFINSIDSKHGDLKRELDTLRYLKEVIRNQAYALGSDIELCDLFLDELKKEREIDLAWEEHN